MEVHRHSANPLENTVNACLKRQETSSHVPTLKHEVKQQLITKRRLFQLLNGTHKQANKQTVVSLSRCLTSCFSDRTSTGHHLAFGEFLFFYSKCISCFSMDCWSANAPLLFSVSDTVSTISSSQDCAICHNNAVEHHI